MLHASSSERAEPKYCLGDTRFSVGEYRDFGLLVCGTSEVSRADGRRTLLRNVGACQEITWSRISECAHLPVYNNSDVPAAATPVPQTVH